MISQVSPSAFTGTQLKWLQLEHNSLTEFPDLRVVSATFGKLFIYRNKISVIPQELVDGMEKLWYIHITWNPLIQIPDFTNVGNKHVHLVINRTTGIEIGREYLCSVGLLRVYYEAGDVPQLKCDSQATLTHLYMQYRDYDSNTNFTNLISAGPNLNELVLDNNNFEEDFPDIPNEVRTRIKYFYVRSASLAYISPVRLENFSLNHLNLSDNKLVSVPLKTFNVTKKLMLRKNPWEEFSFNYWQSALCQGYGNRLNYLDLSETAENVLQWSIMESAQCLRNIDLHILAYDVS